MEPNSDSQAFPPPTAAPQPVVGAAVSTSKKNPFSKKVVIIGLAVLAFLILALVLVKLFSSKIVGTGKNEIVWWGLWEDAPSVQPLIDEYQKANPKVKIKYIRASQQDYRERLTSALAKGPNCKTGEAEGCPPDIFTIHNSWVPMFKSELDPLPGSVMNPAEYAQTFYPVATSDFTTDKGIVAIPLEYDGLNLFVNDDIFAAAGKTPPKTWDELRELAHDPALTKKDDQGRITQSAVALGRTENVDNWQEILALMMLQNGVDLTKPSECFTVGAGSSGAPAETCLGADALQFFTVFSGSDGVWDASLPSSTIFFASGNLAMYFAPSWRAFEIQQKNPAIKFHAVPLPQLAKNSPDEPDVTYASYWAQGVWTRSTKKDEAWKFLKFLSSKESLEKMYQNEAAGRVFGEPYPRVDMADLLKDQPLIGSLIAGAKDAQSWYLHSRTFDGPTGINSQISKYFEDAVNAVNDRSTPTQALEPVSEGVNQVLSRYGLIK